MTHSQQTYSIACLCEQTQRCTLEWSGVERVCMCLSWYQLSVEWLLPFYFSRTCCFWASTWTMEVQWDFSFWDSQTSHTWSIVSFTFFKSYKLGFLGFCNCSSSSRPSVPVRPGSREHPAETETPQLLVFWRVHGRQLGERVYGGVMWPGGGQGDLWERREDSECSFFGVRLIFSSSAFLVEFIRSFALSDGVLGWICR